MTPNPSKAVIIVAGGVGSRMQADIPKQFLLLAGKPVLMHSLEKFKAYDPEITVIVAMHTDYTDYWKELCRKYAFSLPHQIVPGGKTRFHSVKNALDLIGNEVFTAVHDAARPLISPELIQRLFEAAAQSGAAIPAISVSESVRSVQNGNSRPVDRSNLRLIQTPQVFETEILKSAYRLVYRPEFTDDASVVEAYRQSITLVEGEPQNIKITNPVDIKIAEALR